MQNDGTLWGAYDADGQHVAVFFNQQDAEIFVDRINFMDEDPRELHVEQLTEHDEILRIVEQIIGGRQ